MNHRIRELLLAEEPGPSVFGALCDLLEKDGQLLRIDVNERSIVHRFALYLQQKMPSLHVDCEYNRDGVDPKHIEHFYLDPSSEDTEAKTVFPDVIAHIRGTDKNYLVIELKKSTNRVSRDVDFAKLRGYKRDLGYKHALFIELLAGDANADVAYVEWVDS
jgi:hypothetical protein